MDPKQLIRLLVLDSPQGKVLKTKGFKTLGQKEIVMKCADANVGAKVLMKLAEQVLNKTILLSCGGPITNITKSPLYARLDIFEGEECFVITDH